MGGMGGGSGGMGGIGSAFGGILDAFGNMTKAHNQNSLAIEQRNKANQLASQSANTVSPALQKEFTNALQTKQMLAANGIPNLDIYNSQLDSHMADSAAQALQMGGSGDSILATLSALDHNNNTSRLALDEQDAQGRSNNVSNLVNTMWGIGAERDNNDAIRRAQQARLNFQSGALTDASTANRYQSKNKNTDATTGLLSSVYNLAGSAAGGGGGAEAGTSKKGYKETPVQTPYMQQDSTNLTGDQGINTTPSSGNMDWTSFGGFGG